MSGHTPEDFAVVARKTRAVGATAIVAMLIADRYRAIETEKEPDFEAGHRDRMKTKAAQYLLKEYEKVHTRAQDLEKRIRAMGLTVHTHRGYALAVAYDVSTEKRKQYRENRERRLKQVKALKLSSYLDLLGKDAKAAKVFLLELKKKLEAV